MYITFVRPHQKCLAYTYTIFFSLQVDVENLSKLFQQLHFKAEHKKNLSRPQFLTCLREFANNPDHRNADMMILAVLSHGRDGQIIASDGLVVETEDIYAKFNNR